MPGASPRARGGEGTTGHSEVSGCCCQPATPLFLRGPAATVYALLPWLAGRPPWRHAAPSRTWSLRLRVPRDDARDSRLVIVFPSGPQLVGEAPKPRQLPECLDNRPEEATPADTMALSARAFAARLRAMRAEAEHRRLSRAKDGQSGGMTRPASVTPVGPPALLGLGGYP